MHFISTILALSFLATCYRRGNPNIINFIRERYGYNDLKSYRRIIDTSKKLAKTKLDIDFLKKCKNL